MDRQQVMEQIAAIDRQIMELSKSKRVPELNRRYRSFPVGAWIAAAVVCAVAIYADAIPGSGPFLPYAKYLLLLGIVMAVFALFRTVMFLLKGNVKADKNYVAAMERVNTLEKEKKALQAQLDA